MGEMSRVKKYEELRESLNEKNNDVDEIESAVSELRRRENKHNSDTTSFMKRSFQDDNDVLDDTSEFKNEFLDSYIQEVKEYNKEKGLRRNDDTSLDILEQLSAKQRLKRSGYPMNDEPVETVDAFDLHETRTSRNQRNQANLHQLNEQIEANKSSADETKQVPNPSIEEMANMALKKAEEMEASVERLEDEVEDKEPTTSIKSNKEVSEPVKEEVVSDDTKMGSQTKEHLIEQTQKIQRQLDKTQTKFNNLQEELETNSEHTAKLLNVVIGILFLLLVGVLILIVAWVVLGGIG